MPQHDRRHHARYDHKDFSPRRHDLYCGSWHDFPPTDACHPPASLTAMRLAGLLARVFGAVWGRMRRLIILAQRL